MDALALVIGAAAFLLAGYLLYGRWLSRRLFDLDDANPTPATTQTDGRDFVPTKRSVLFGHHFTSIAGTGPIVGPAIAVMWGWLPALAWVLLGSVFIGAVHDLGSLVVSLRNKGRSVGDVAGDLLGPRARFLFLCILIGALWIVLAIFGLVIASVLRQYPQAITPVLIQIPLAVLIGVFIHRRGGGIGLASIAALAAMYASVVVGDWGPLHAFNEAVAAAPMWAWVAGLLAYCYAASVLPVWLLLQPRDYINALQLVSCLVLIMAGLAEATGGDGRPELSIVAPMINWQPTGAPPLLPVLFITVACGACSGFHCLVSSGTSSKQLRRETDAKPVGYGAMLTEALLAVLVIAACAAGLGLGVQKDIAYHQILVGVNDAPRTDPQSQQVEAQSSRRVSQGSLESPLLWYSAIVPLEPLSFDETPWSLFQFGSRTAFGDADRLIPNDLRWTIPDGAPPAFLVNWNAADQSLADFASTFAVGNTLLLATYLHIDSVKEFSQLQQRDPYRHVFVKSTPAPGAASLPIDPSSTATAQIVGTIAFDTQYASWQSAGSLGAKVGAFVQGAANFIASLGVPLNVAVALMAVMVASFAATTLDTSCRLQRYVVQELSRTFLPRRDPGMCKRCGYDLRGQGAADERRSGEATERRRGASPVGPTAATADRLGDAGVPSETPAPDRSAAATSTPPSLRRFPSPAPNATPPTAPPTSPSRR